MQRLVNNGKIVLITTLLLVVGPTTLFLSRI